MTKPLNLIGKRYGRLVVLERLENSHRGNTRWLCACDCGRTISVIGTNLNCGITKSCGCLPREEAKQRFITHGQTKTRLYHTWKDIRQRCSNSHRADWQNYGGRGIAVCAEWNDFSNFQEWALSSGYKNGLTIDRINVDGNYEPSNCRWIPKSDQSKNRRSCIIYKGKCASEWARELGISLNVIQGRLRLGWSLEDAIFTTVRHLNRNH